MIKKFNIKDNTFVRYEVIGKGPPILLLHTIRNGFEYSYKASRSFGHSAYLSVLMHIMSRLNY